MCASGGRAMGFDRANGSGGRNQGLGVGDRGKLCVVVPCTVTRLGQRSRSRGRQLTPLRDRSASAARRPRQPLLHPGVCGFSPPSEGLSTSCAALRNRTVTTPSRPNRPQGCRRDPARSYPRGGVAPRAATLRRAVPWVGLFPRDRCRLCRGIGWALSRRLCLEGRVRPGPRHVPEPLSP